MSQNSMGHSHQATLAGVVVRLPATFDECPDFVTLEMLSDTGARVYDSLEVSHLAAATAD